MVEGSFFHDTGPRDVVASWLSEAAKPVEEIQEDHVCHQGSFAVRGSTEQLTPWHSD